ncbi:MAG: type II toxin-antitoxin system HicA family toxin [Thermodesulfobacteriota bacterium]
MSDLYRDLTRVLRQAGCIFAREGKGSHELWFSPITKRTFSVPANIKSHHLANDILKQAGLPKKY